MRYSLALLTLTLCINPTTWASQESENAAKRNAVVESVCTKLIEGYIYEERGKQLATWIRGRRDAGHYDELSLAGTLRTVPRRSS